MPASRRVLCCCYTIFRLLITFSATQLRIRVDRLQMTQEQELSNDMPQLEMQNIITEIVQA